MKSQLSDENYELDFSDLLDSPETADAIFSPSPVSSAREAAADDGAENNSPGAAATEGEKYVVFQLDDKLYAVHSRQTSEVIASLPATPLPPCVATDWLAGIINLRGSVVPVVDLRRLWRKNTAQPPKTKFLVLQPHKSVLATSNAAFAPTVATAAAASPLSSSSAANILTAAFVVDRLSEIVTLRPSDIEFSAADFESSFPTFFGMATHKSRTLYLLDAENLFSSLTVGER